MRLPTAKRISAEKYIAGLSVFKKKLAKIKLSANESAFGPSPKVVKEYNKISKSLKFYPDSEGAFLRKKLAKKRAKAVYKELVSLGIDSGRLTFKGYGNKKPIYKNPTSGLQSSENRRVEIIVKALN